MDWRTRVLVTIASLMRRWPVRGRTALGMSLYRALRPPDGTMRIPLERGHVMDLPTASSQGWNAAFTGRYDDEELELVAEAVGPGTCALDVGASLGFYTIPLARLAQDMGGRVVAFEPVRGNLRVLRHNVDLNDLGDVVEVRPVGLGRSSGSFRVDVEAGGTGNAVIALGSGDTPVPTGGTEDISVVALDELGDLPTMPCSLVKMDVEGFEMEVLTGGEQFLDRHRPTIFGEFGLEYLRARGVPDDAPMRWADAHGYHCDELVYAHPSPHLDRREIRLRRLTPSDRRSGTSLWLRPRDDVGGAEGRGLRNG